MEERSPSEKRSEASRLGEWNLVAGFAVNLYASRLMVVSLKSLTADFAEERGGANRRARV
jgi:hypothetical protein